MVLNMTIRQYFEEIEMFVFSFPESINWVIVKRILEKKTSHQNSCIPNAEWDLIESFSSVKIVHVELILHVLQVADHHFVLGHWQDEVQLGTGIFRNHLKILSSLSTIIFRRTTLLSFHFFSMQEERLADTFRFD